MAAAGRTPGNGMAHIRPTFWIGLLLAGGLFTGPESETLARGGRIYEDRCDACHGLRGDGRGRYTDELDTPPASFTHGVFKFRSSGTGSPPTDEDLLRTLERGVRGTAMLPWPGLSRRDKLAVIRYVRSFSPWLEVEEAPEPVRIPPPPPPSEELLRDGRRLYSEAGCAKCHGEAGRGDGPRADDLTDDLARPIRPTDFARGLFKTGPDVAGIYRTLATGLDGTSMPSYGEAYGPEELWAISYYVRSLGPEWPDRGRGRMGMMGVMMSGFVTPDERRGMRIDMPGMPGMGGMMGPFSMGGSMMGQMGPGQDMGGGMMGGWGWGLGMVVGTLLSIALLVLVVVIIWRLLQGRGETRGPANSPLEILKRRYASGEIDRAEFEAKKRDLG